MPPVAHTGGKSFMMDINKYKTSEQFERNEAIYVLHKLDGTPMEEISLNFNLSLNEIGEIIDIHEKYQKALEA